jgi:hypothetical protein
MLNSRDVRNMIRRIVGRDTQEYPGFAVVQYVDGRRAAIRFGNSSTIQRNVRIVGDPDTLEPGMTVVVRWDAQPGGHKQPVVLAPGGGSGNTTIATGGFPPDNITLENKPQGMGVKIGGIGLQHLNFRPSLEGHTHEDSLQMGGWQVTDDGILYNGETAIHPNGMIVLGRAPDIVKLDSEHATYRIWAGDTDPASAPFSVSKAGAVHATLGDIGGWNITDTEINADSGNAFINAVTPAIGLGATTFGAGDGFWVGKDGGYYKLRVGDPSGGQLSWDGLQLQIGGWNIETSKLTTDNGAVGLSSEQTGGTDWRLWIGDADPSLAPFRVDENGECWLESAHVAVSLESTNYVAGISGWKLYDTGYAEFEDVRVRGELVSTVFKYNEIQASAGTLGVWPSSGVLYEELTTLTSPTPFLLKVRNRSDGTSTFSAGDDLRVKNYTSTGILDNWMHVSTGAGELPVNYGDYTEYTCYLDDGTPGTFPAGVSVVDYGQNGSGFITLSADGAVGASPNMTIGVQHGSPWVPYDPPVVPYGTEAIMRLGNLNGVLGIGSDTYGFAVGELRNATTGNYLRYDPTNGLILQAGGGAMTLDEDGMKVEVGTTYEDVRSLRFENAGTKVARLAGYLDGTLNAAGLDVYPITGRSAYLSLNAYAPAHEGAVALMGATSGATGATGLVLSNNDSINQDTYARITVRGSSAVNFDYALKAKFYGDVVTPNKLGVGTEYPMSTAHVDGTGGPLLVTAYGSPSNPGKAGLEIEYDQGQDWADILSYDRSSSTYKPMRLRGSSVELYTPGGASLQLYDTGPRINNNYGFWWRNYANTADVRALIVDASNDIRIGSGGNPTETQIFFDVYGGGNIVSLGNAYLSLKNGVSIRNMSYPNDNFIDLKNDQASTNAVLMSTIAQAYFVLDSNNNSSSSGLHIMRDNPDPSAATEIFQIREDGHIFINGGTNYLMRNSNFLRWQTGNGYLDMGCNNGTYAHFYTDAPSFYFSSPLVVNGNLTEYSAGKTVDYSKGQFSTQNSAWLSMTCYQQTPFNIPYVSGSIGMVLFVGAVPRTGTLRRWTCAFKTNGTMNSSNYWTIALKNAAGATLDSFNTHSYSGGGSWAVADRAITSSVSTSTKILYIQITGYTGSPGNLWMGSPQLYVE